MFFQVYFKAFAVNISIESDFKPNLSYVLNSKNPNYYCISKNLANINLSGLKGSLFENLDIFDAIFHEVDHSQQHYSIETDEVEYENLKFVKDIILRGLLPNYYSRNENYFVTSIESNARYLAFLQTSNLLENYNEMEYINFINKKRALWK